LDEDGGPVGPDRVGPDQLENADRWLEANPGLGIRISEEHVAYERGSMDSRTFAVERLGIGDWPAVDGAAAVIDLEKWVALTDEGSRPVDPVCFAFDVTPDRAGASIAAAGKRADGLLHVEVADRRRGTGWLADRIAELVERHRSVGVCCDATGPAGSLLPELAALGVQVEPVSAREHASACGLLYDQVEQGGLRHLGTGELMAALRGAARRPLGDAWAWSRKTSAVDISPLVASTLALWKASEGTPEAFVMSW
jgi:hypothetical protein